MIIQMLSKFMKIVSISEQTESTKSTGRLKTSFPKKKVESADMYKPVLNKITATHEYCVKTMT